MKRLVETLNTATGNCLSSHRLDKAFELCYSDLENSLKSIKNLTKDENAQPDDSNGSHKDSNILEELLETARNTQRLLGNTDAKLYNNLDEVQKKVDSIVERIEQQNEYEKQRYSRKIRSVYFEDLLYHQFKDSNNIFPYNILILLALYKEDFPWLYDAGSELVKIILSNSTKSDKVMAIEKFKSVLEYTGPMARDMYGIRKESLMLLRELPMVFDRFIDNI